MLRTSLIILTYNWPAALRLVLSSVARQIVLPDEVIVTDDGSRSDTRELMLDVARTFPVPLRHVWQADDGARMARARNRGIAAARGEYLVLIDGDMLLQRDAIADHIDAARSGFFVQGVRLLTNAARAQTMLQTGQFDLNFFSSGIDRRRHTLRNLWLSHLLSGERRGQHAIRSCNMGFWREDLLRVNGFNEAMTGWGREDNELVARCYNAGIKRRDLRFAGLATHLYHTTRKQLENNPNDVILLKAQTEKIVRCEFGLEQHLAEFAEGPLDLRQISLS